LVKEKEYLFILCLFLFAGCQQKTSGIGFYKDPEHKIEIRQDSTFVYECLRSHFYEHNIGKWSINYKNQNELHLSSSPRIIEPSVIIKSKEVNSIESTPTIKSTLIIKNTSKQLHEFGYWLFSDQGTLKNGSCDSISDIKNENIKYLQFYFSHSSKNSTLGHAGINSNKIYIQKGYDYELTIELDYKYFYLKPFNNVRCKVKKGKIVLHDFDKRKSVVLTKFNGDTLDFFRHYKFKDTKMNYEF
jgi:hypothetical protein